MRKCRFTQGISLACALLLLTAAGCSTPGTPEPRESGTASVASVPEEVSADATEPNGGEPGGPQSEAETSGGATASVPAGGKTTTAGKTTADSGKTTAPSSGGKAPFTNDKAFDAKKYEFTIASPWLKAKSDYLDTEFEALFFERKAEVEKLFNCTITIQNFTPSVSNMQPKILAGDKVADIVEMSPEFWLGSAANEFIVPMEDIEGINIQDKRWISAYTFLTSFKGKHWGLQFLKPVEVRACIFFNKDLVKQDMYALVNNKQWTFDKFGEISLAVAKDTNNDGVNDIWGSHMVDPLNAVHFMLQANNGALAKTNARGEVVEAFTEKEAVHTLDYLSKWANVDKTLYTSDIYRGPNSFGSLGFDESINLFTSGKVAFLITESWVGNQQLKSKVKNFKYGMLPLPMGPDAKDYVSPAQNARTFSITSTNKDLKYTVPIFNALAAGLEGYEGEDWMWEEIQNEYFQDTDKNSLDMYKLCLNKSSVDIGVAVPKMLEEWRMYAGVYTVFFRTETPTSAGDKITGTYDNLINKLFNK